MRLAVLLLTFLCAVPALAQSVRIGERLIQTGDSEARVVRVAGAPDRIVTLEAAEGGAVGERWSWYDIGDAYNARSLSIRMRGGQVADIDVRIER